MWGRGKETRAGDMYVVGIASEIEIMVKQKNTAEGEFGVRSGRVVLPRGVGPVRSSVQHVSGHGRR